MTYSNISYTHWLHHVRIGILDEVNKPLEVNYPPVLASTSNSNLGELLKLDHLNLNVNEQAIHDSTWQIHAQAWSHFWSHIWSLI